MNETNVPAHAPAATPVRHRPNLLTLKYAGAVLSAVVATLASLYVLDNLFLMWTGSDGANLLASFTGSGKASMYVNMVSGAVAAVAFAVLAYLLYRKVTKDVAARPEYVKTGPYAFVTHGFVAIMAIIAVFIAANIVSVLISSLLLIGAHADIGDMYLNKFLPDVASLALVAFVGYMAYKIALGKNKSPTMTMVLLGVAGAILLGTLITVPIKAHGGSGSTLDSNSSTKSSDYFKDLYQ